MPTVNSRRRRLGAAAALTVALAAPAACSSTHTTHGPSGSSGVGGVDPAGPGSGGSAPGVAAKSLSCDRFAADRLLSAARQVVPAALVRVGQAPTDVNDDTLACGYEFYTDGTDLTSADYGMIQVSVQISDAWDQNVVLDGNDDDKENAEAFAADRDSARAGQGPLADEDGATDVFVDLPDLGHGGFVEDVHRTADGVDQSWNASLEVLRVPRPYRVEIDLSFVVPQPDQSVPDTSLDDAMKDQSKRVALVRGLATVVLASMPS